ncbi:hypothetical protein FB446DRAFT_848144 [Lentinula raphanica]|nr:hypothetical protein FB446DRAFT_848144 [Lentinula raphanica]KAJ3827918.1 hypothetical protein F5880DRAFT_1608925 [Lentinula raphanica]
MHLPIPCTPSVEIPHFLGFSSKFSNSSPTCSLYLLSLFVFAILGAAALVKLFLVRRARTKQERNTIQKSEKEQSFQRRTFSSFVKGWDGINWPVTLTAPPSTAAVGRGVGLNGAVLGKQMQQPVRNGVSCDQSLPTIYQSKEPISMAKMIMSRHTFRRPSMSSQRPTQAPPRRPASLSPPPLSSKPQSMV